MPRRNVLVLPGVIFLQETLVDGLLHALAREFRFAPDFLLYGPESVVLVDIQDMDGVGASQRPVAPDDGQVLVVGVGGLEAEVVAAGDHHAIFLRHRVDDDDLVMHDGMPDLQQFLVEVGDRIFHGCGPHQQHIGRSSWGIDGR